MGRGAVELVAVLHGKEEGCRERLSQSKGWGGVQGPESIATSCAPSSDTFIQKTKKLYMDTRTQRNMAVLNNDLSEVHARCVHAWAEGALETGPLVGRVACRGHASCGTWPHPHLLLWSLVGWCVRKPCIHTLKPPRSGAVFTVPPPPLLPCCRCTPS